MDTVPPHPDWQQNPLTVTVDDQNVAHGLGVADMKGGIAAILRVAEFAVENNYPLKLAFGVDEENISLGSHVLVQTDFFEDVVFLISAESGQVLNETQDFAINYGRKGRFVIAAEILGRQAHAARSDQAVNAITEAARLLLLIDQLQFPRHQFLENTQVIPFACESRTSAFDIPGSAHLELNILSVPGTTSENTIAQLEQLCHENGISAKFQLAERPTPYMEAYEIDRHHPLVIALEEEVFAHYNTIPAYGTSVADENRFATALRIPVISLGPVGGGDHTEHEWVRVESLGKTLSVYQDIVRFFAQRA
ncbi:M20/M25/M40 family metallo-hydrolase [Candidatus Woesebacteria bacterium]|nr:M20/M25/M40 family metallo-hydrolase [Candidatus Woesebacteria bacterium]